jgi:hypothetical protein
MRFHVRIEVRIDHFYHCWRLPDKGIGKRGKLICAALEIFVGYLAVITQLLQNAIRFITMLTTSKQLMYIRYSSLGTIPYFYFWLFRIWKL